MLIPKKNRKEVYKYLFKGKPSRAHGGVARWARVAVRDAE